MDSTIPCSHPLPSSCFLRPFPPPFPPLLHFASPAVCYTTHTSFPAPSPYRTRSLYMPPFSLPHFLFVFTSVSRNPFTHIRSDRTPRLSATYVIPASNTPVKSTSSRSIVMPCDLWIEIPHAYVQPFSPTLPASMAAASALPRRVRPILARTPASPPSSPARPAALRRSRRADAACPARWT